VFLERIPMTMGRTKLVMNVGLLGSWAGALLVLSYDAFAIDRSKMGFAARCC
jgi:hypothetical protein